MISVSLHKLYVLVLLILSCQLSCAQISNALNGLLLNKNLPVQIPYADEKSALTFSLINSTYFKDISQNWTKNNTNSKAQGKTSGHTNLFYTDLEPPKEWENKQKIILINCPKINMEVVLNGKVIAHIEKDIPACINITALLTEGINILEVRAKSKESLSSIGDMAAEISLFATPAIHMNYLYNYFSWDGIHPRSGYYYAGFLQLIKNYADPTWHTHKYKNILKVYDNQLIVQREAAILETRQKVSPKEGWVTTGFHDARFQRWTAEMPYLHTATIQVLNSANEVTEVFSEKVGFRTLKIKDKQLQVNNIPIHLKAVYFSIPSTCECTIDIDSLRQVLLTIKQHNINTLILSQYPAIDKLYSLCDEIGLYVIQHIDFSASTPDLHRLKVMATVNLLKNHPSLLAWYAEPGPDNQSTYQALKDTIGIFDSQRPVLLSANHQIENFPSNKARIPHWEQLIGNRLSKLKKEYQSIDFWVKHHTENTLQLTNQYDFISLKNMILHWQIISADSILKQGEITDLDTLPGKTQAVKLPFSFNDYKNNLFRFTLRLKEKTAWAEAGQEIAYEAFKFSKVNYDYVLNKSSE